VHKNKKRSERVNAFVGKTIRQAKRLIIAIIGFTVLLIGLAMVVLPGPAFIVIPIALGILATEFIWAKKLLDRVKSRASNVKEWVSKQ
jgi:tellurite resistance protein TerC